MIAFGLELYVRLIVVPQGVAMFMPPQAKCVKTNDLFIGPLKKPLSKFEGAIGGVLLPLVYLVLVALAVWGIIEVVRNKDASKVFQVMMLVALIPFALLVIMLFVRSLWNAMNQAAC